MWFLTGVWAMISWNWLFEKSKYSFVIISVFILSVTAILLIMEPSEDYHAFIESGFLLFGIPIVYATCIFDTKTGYGIAVTSQICNMLVVRNEIVKEITQNKVGELFFDVLAIPLAYLLGCVILGHVILKERILFVKYRNLANELADK
jgi:hypothetical protein